MIRLSKTLLAAGMFLAMGISVEAGPNEACADQEGFALAQSMVKDQTAFVKTLKTNFLDKMVSAGMMPRNYSMDELVKDLKSKGVDTLAGEWAHNGIDADRRKGIATTVTVEELKSILLKSVAESHFAELAMVYDTYLTIDRKPVATNYDKELNRVHCTFTYNLNFSELRKVAVAMHDQRQIDIFDQSSRITSAIGSRSTAIYTIQPDGRGGSTLQLLRAE